MKPEKRDVDLIVLSDIHLGTYGCHAKELLQYLKSVNPRRVVLNGDIIDIWQFNKRYWPKTHMQVIKHITGLIANGVKVQYITGNHDEMLRKFVGFKMGSFSIENKAVIDLNGKKGWVFHGDVFDVTMQYSKWLTMLGAVGYDSLIILNRLINFLLVKAGRGPISMSKRVKNSVKSAVKFINNFEETVADIAIRNQYEYVICGHIHQPVIRDIEMNGKSVSYLNSGDWIENLTALEYNKGEWSIYSYENDLVAQSVSLVKNQGVKKNRELFEILREEFNLIPA